MKKFSVPAVFLIIVITLVAAITAYANDNLTHVQAVFLMPIPLFLLIYATDRMIEYSRAELRWYNLLPFSLRKETESDRVASWASGIKATTLLINALFCFTFVTGGIEILKVVTGVLVTLNIICLLPFQIDYGTRILRSTPTISIFNGVVFLLHSILAIPAFIFWGNAFLAYVAIVGLVFWGIRISLKKEYEPMTSAASTLYGLCLMILFWVSFLIDIYTADTMLGYLFT
jgi:hypothetical protein